MALPTRPTAFRSTAAAAALALLVLAMELRAMHGHLVHKQGRPEGALLSGASDDASTSGMEQYTDQPASFVLRAAAGNTTAYSPFTDKYCLSPSAQQDAVERFSRLIQFRTVSDVNAPQHVQDVDEFHKLHEWLPQAFPVVWSHMLVEKVGEGGLSLLLTWQGTDQGLAPALFISHLDVVPVPVETLPLWTHGPFSGAVADGYIWGRGTLDVKVGVAGLLEAATDLINMGFVPRRTIMFAFGHDEEVGGEQGAARTAQLLEQRGIQLEVISDEGGSIGSDGYPPYMDHPLALIGTAEKGYATVLLHVNGSGGHSSLPPINGSSTAAIVGRILSRIDVLPPPVALLPPVTTFLKAIAPYTKGIRGTLFALVDLPFVGEVVAKAFMAMDGAEQAALVRTTAAVTGLQSGIAENVMPPAASVRVNFRLLPGTAVDDLVDYLKRTIGERDMAHVTLELSPGQQPSTATPITPASSTYFQLLRQALQEVYTLKGGGTVEVAPYLMPGGTDSKHYLNISRVGALRSVPVTVNKTAGDLARVHGLNERVLVADYGRAICVYRRALQLFAGAAEPGEEAAQGAQGAAGLRRGRREAEAAQGGGAGGARAEGAGAAAGQRAWRLW